MPETAFHYSDAELDQFRQVQRLAYDIAQRVESQLAPGMSEVDVCDLLGEEQRRVGVTQVFHEPFAWFGRRTLLGAEWAPDVADAAELASIGEAGGSSFFPTDEVLDEGMALIVDLAPVRDGYSSDIGYSAVIGGNEVFEELDAGLAEIRGMLLAGIREGETLLSLYRGLDDHLAARGWQNCHQHYPDRALGHIVFRVEADPDRVTPIPGFGTAAAEGLLAAGMQALSAGTCYPVWNDSEFTDLPASPGLWAVEPHIGKDGVGAKFEELLVVTDDDAYWLDESLPHCARWEAAGYLVETVRD